MIIYGHRLYGKVDAIPGVGHVATKFIHIDFVPLVPTESWLVTQQSGKSWRGVKIPISAKSIVVAWGRAASLVIAVLGAVGIVAELSGRRVHPEAVAVSAVVALAAVGFFVLTKTHRLFTRASYARACDLAKRLGMNEHGLAQLAAAYGQPLPTYGFRPVMPPPAATDPAPAMGLAADLNRDVQAIPVEIDVDGEQDDALPAEVPPPAPPTRAAPPLRGY